MATACDFNIVVPSSFWEPKSKFNKVWFFLEIYVFFFPFFFIEKQQKEIQMQSAISIEINAFMKYQTSIGICWYQTTATSKW
jgi:hypothetical protein